MVVRVVVKKQEHCVAPVVSNEVYILLAACQIFISKKMQEECWKILSLRSLQSLGIRYFVVWHIITDFRRNVLPLALRVEKRILKMGTESSSETWVTIYQII